MSNRRRIDAKSTPEEGRARRIRGVGSGGSVPNLTPLTILFGGEGVGGLQYVILAEMIAK